MCYISVLQFEHVRTL